MAEAGLLWGKSSIAPASIRKGAEGRTADKIYLSGKRIFRAETAARAAVCDPALMPRLHFFGLSRSIVIVPKCSIGWEVGVARHQKSVGPYMTCTRADLIRVGLIRR